VNESQGQGTSASHMHIICDSFYFARLFYRVAVACFLLGLPGCGYAVGRVRLLRVIKVNPSSQTYHLSLLIIYLLID